MFEGAVSTTVTESEATTQALACRSPHVADSSREFYSPSTTLPGFGWCLTSYQTIEPDLGPNVR